MKNIFLNRYFKVVLGFFVLAISGSMIAVFSASSVPDEYLANKGIQDSRKGTLGIFVEIDSSFNKTGKPVSASKFTELNGYFQSLFAAFPQDFNFRVIYQQCIDITTSLATNPNNNIQQGSFLSDCYKPFNDILKTINNKYTIIPSAKASPSSGPSPLTVTFDARASKDPSNETIPSSNFFWYYRDTDGNDKIIGKGPVISYTFSEPGNYLVHLTVRSSNKGTSGIFDGEKTLSIDVTPKTAIITVYANGQKMTKNDPVKMGTMEAEKGIVFDAGATIPMGGRQIISNHREITSQEGFTYKKDADGNPDLVRVSLPGQGQFKVSLTTIDNEGNKVNETYYIVISDPIAILKQSPEVGNTSSTWSFDASASYSVLSKVRLYTREIFDQEGTKIEVFQGSSIKQNFKEPGSYTVKLTVEDEQGQINSDTSHVIVDSTDPIPQYSIEPTSQWLYPSSFVLNAGLSSDIDQAAGFDKLSYSWSFPDDAKAVIVSNENNNEKIKVEFNAVGKFKVKLIVTDQYGKLSEIEKEIEVKSILRPEMEINPVATYRGNDINFIIKSNIAILNYQWDLGDGDKRSIQVANLTHKYKQTGVYMVTLTVNTANGDMNQVTKTVFIGERDYPVAGYIINDKLNEIKTQNDVCIETIDGKELSNAAYRVDRYADFIIDPSLSVNSKGLKTDLSFYFQPGGKEIYKQSDFKYKFDELGCQFIDMTAEDTSIGKNNKIRIWFKVVNALPTLDNLILFFPQYGNEMGVGFNENQVRDIFNDQFDPLIVKVTATNPVDPDGNLSYFKRYYFYKDDPSRLLETKITPSNVPYAFFSLPRIAGEFMFGVTMYDNEDGSQSSTDIIGNGPVVFFPPDATKPDVPLVTLRVDQSQVDVGDEVTFDVISKIISGRPDFVSQRTIYYDFDGDGTWDLTTKDDRVKYAYPTPSDPTLGGYTPRASVLYRGFRGVTNGGKVIVKNGLKPRLLYDKFGKFVIFRDISLGDIEQKEFCLDLKNCSAKNTITGGTAFSFEYPDFGRYFVSLDVTDQYANKASKKIALSLESSEVMTGDFHILSIPQVSWSGETPEFIVGNNLDNSIIYYIKYNNTRGQCYVDVNVALDSDGDGVVDNDNDFNCNQLYMQKYTPGYYPVVGRMYYSDSDLKMVSKDFNVSFLDFEVKLDPSLQAVYDKITALLDSMQGDAWLSGANLEFKSMMSRFRDNLMDPNVVRSSVVEMGDYLSNNSVALSDDQLTNVNAILDSLSDKSVVAAQGGNEYDKAKAEILSILPINLSAQVSNLFDQFEVVVGDATLDVSQQDKRKEVLQKIVDTINSNVVIEGTAQAGQIDKIDMDTIVIPNMCIIMGFYGINSSLCSNDNTIAVPDNVPVETGTTTTSLLKIIFIVLAILVGVFLVLVVIFAVRARMNQAQEQETLAEEENIPPPPAV